MRVQAVLNEIRKHYHAPEAHPYPEPRNYILPEMTKVRRALAVSIRAVSARAEAVPRRMRAARPPVLRVHDDRAHPAPRALGHAAGAAPRESVDVRR